MFLNFSAELMRLKFQGRPTVISRERLLPAAIGINPVRRFLFLIIQRHVEQVHREKRTVLTQLHGDGRLFSHTDRTWRK